MLTSFVVKRVFYKLEARIYVDCEKMEGWIDMTYARVIVAQSAIPHEDVKTPELAEKWLTQPYGDYATFIEGQEAYFRSIYERPVDKATSKVVDRGARLVAASGS